jgi:GNAT superfamily N-acetyltransferase
MADRTETRVPGKDRSPALLVRRATPADARAIAEIAVAGWQAAYRGLMPDEFLDSLSVAARETGWRTWLESAAEGGDAAWMAEIYGRAVGFVTSGPPRDDDVPAPAAEVYAIYVAPSEWRRGAGRALLEAATAEWWRRDAAALVLWVLEGNVRGRAFYEALGWQLDGESRDIELGDLAVPEVRYRLVRPV